MSLVRVTAHVAEVFRRLWAWLRRRPLLLAAAVPALALLYVLVLIPFTPRAPAAPPEVLAPQARAPRRIEALPRIVIGPGVSPRVERPQLPEAAPMQAPERIELAPLQPADAIPAQGGPRMQEGASNSE